MSQSKDQAIAAARQRDWPNAFFYANGLDMNEMLGLMAKLGHSLLGEMRTQSDTFRFQFDVPRLLYAMDVVETRGLPTSAPGDLEVSGQVGTSRRFLQNSATQIPAAGSSGDGAGGLESVIKALEAKRLIAEFNNVKGQLRACAGEGQWTDPKGNVMRMSDGLISTVAGLVDKDSTMTIMSMFRFGNGAHGEKQSDGSGLGRALDVMAYGGFDINLKAPENAGKCISGVAAVMAHLPPGKYALGLPRPGGGSKFDPSQDVFLPVTSLDQVTKSPGKSFQKDLALVLEPAQTALRAAAAGNPNAKIEFMFPDAVDHVHLKCTS